MPERRMGQMLLEAQRKRWPIGSCQLPSLTMESPIQSYLTECTCRQCCDVRRAMLKV